MNTEKCTILCHNLPYEGIMSSESMSLHAQYHTFTTHNSPHNKLWYKIIYFYVSITILHILSSWNLLLYFHKKNNKPKREMNREDDPRKRERERVWFPQTYSRSPHERHRWINFIRLFHCLTANKIYPFLKIRLKYKI